MQILKSHLKKICKEGIIVDIILFGSSVKEKPIPKDIDVAVLFREEDYNKIDEISYKIKKIGDRLNLKLHIEPLIIDNIHKEPLYLNLIHEGFSIKNNEFINKKLKTESKVLITYSLENLTHSKKTLFGYALKGRKGTKGILQEINGEVVGRNSILVPVEKSENIKNFLDNWKLNYKMKRVIII